MFLYFFKTQMRNMGEAQGQALVRDDYRVNLLVQMIFNQYDPAQVEFAYQVSTVLSLSILTKFYGLELISDQKDILINGLLLLNSQGGNMGDGSFLPEIPSLVFCLHLLKTETNAQNLAAAVNNLSMVYLLSIGERIDALAVSNLLAAWNEVGEAT